MRDLTEKCDDIIKLTVSVSLETVVTSLGGGACSQDSILPVCFWNLVERVEAILSFNPRDPSDPVYDSKSSSSDSSDSSENESDSKSAKYTGESSKGSKDKSTKDRDKSGKGKGKGKSSDKDTKDKDKSSGKSTKDHDKSGKGKGKGKGSDRDTGSDKSTKDTKDESTEEKYQSRTESSSSSSESDEMVSDLPRTYLGQLCAEARMAYACVSDNLQEFPPSAARGLTDVLSTMWALAWLRCEGEEYGCAILPSG